MSSEKLTISKLSNIPPRTIFAEGIIKDERMYPQSDLKWIALRGTTLDWVIIYHTIDKDNDWIKENGTKLIDQKKIIELVPCNESAFSKYRY